MKESTQFRGLFQVHMKRDLRFKCSWCPLPRERILLLLLLEEVAEEGERRPGGPLSCLPVSTLPQVPQGLEAVIDSEQLVSHRAQKGVI